MDDYRYKNPILRGSNPDPSIVRVGLDFFLVTSSFEYFPGLPVYHSKDLIKWKLIGHAITRSSQLRIATPEPGGGLWAPTIRWHNGVFYILCASFDRYRPQLDDRVWPQGFYVQTTNVWDSDSWSNPVYFDQIGFDQDIFWDDDGEAYLSSTYRKHPRSRTSPPNQLKDFAIHVCKVYLPTGTATSSPVCIRSSDSGVAEGSHILKRNGYYYLFTAEGGTESGHSEWVSRSSVSPFGPWELGPQNPLWRNTTQDDVQNTGHADILEDADGHWWAVLLAVRPVKTASGEYQASIFGRETFLVPVHWTEDDWPVFNHGDKISLAGWAPGTNVYQLAETGSWSDEFNKPILSLGWYRKNTPLKPDHDYDLVPNDTLHLYGSAYSLSSPACPTLFLRKQFMLDGLWTTRLAFQPRSSQYEAGTCVYWNYFTYASVGTRLHEGADAFREGDGASGRRDIHFTLSNPAVANAKTSTRIYPLEHAQSDVVLLIQCSPTRYRFGFYEVPLNRVRKYHPGELRDISQQFATYVDSDHVTTSIMTSDPPIGASFTGMMLGLYAFGDNQKCLDPASFKFASFQGSDALAGADRAPS